jgi:hypothetical protein
MRIRSSLVFALPAYAAVLMVAAAGTADAVQTLVVRPDSPGTIVTNRSVSPEYAWDDDGSTQAIVTAWFNMSPFSGVSQNVGSDLGTIVGVTLAVDGATFPAFNDDQVRTRWVASGSETGMWHPLPTNGTRDTTFFNVTAERTWSWTDFGTLELVVAHSSQGFPDGLYNLYEIALVVSYIPVVSVEVTDSTFPFGTLPLDNWATPQQTRIINDGTGVEDFNGRLSVFTAGPHTWSLDPAVNGPDTVRAQWSTGGAGGPWNDIAAYDTDFPIQTGIAPSDTVSFWLRILTPTSTGSYDEHSSTLTVSAVEG